MLISVLPIPLHFSKYELRADAKLKKRCVTNFPKWFITMRFMTTAQYMYVSVSQYMDPYHSTCTLYTVQSVPILLLQRYTTRPLTIDMGPELIIYVMGWETGNLTSCL